MTLVTRLTFVELQQCLGSRERRMTVAVMVIMVVAPLVVVIISNLMVTVMVRVTDGDCGGQPRVL